MRPLSRHRIVPGDGFLVFANRSKEHVSRQVARSDKPAYRIHVGDCRGFRPGLTDGARDYLGAGVARIFGELSRIGERHTDEVVIAPDQPTLSDGMKVIE